MPCCAHGHRSSDADYCDVCGIPIAGPGGGCAHCGAWPAASSRYCEFCGADRSPAVWWVRVHVDEDWFARCGGAGRGFTFPRTPPDPRRIRLAGNRALIGRRSRSRDVTPEVDLSGEPKDPCVSRRHAMLLARPDGTWAVTDLGSANGTFVNDSAQRVPERHEVPVGHGDDVHVGLWTTVTLRREAWPSPG